MVFHRTFGEIVFEPAVAPASGMVFLFSPWSEFSIGSLKCLIASLERFPGICLYVLSTDNFPAHVFQERYGVLSHGWGEMFFIWQDHLVLKMLRPDANRDSIESFVRHAAQWQMNAG